jgi:hyperosmotically inducible protein
MHPNRVIISLAVLFLLSTIMGCYTAYKTARDPRSVETQASDQKITTKIQGKLAGEEGLAIFDIAVQAYYGQVFLIGEYGNEDDRDTAIKLAKETEGVKQVSTYLLPKRDVEGCGTGSGLKLNATINKRLVQADDVVHSRINVEMVQCNAVLLGVVSKDRERDRAIEITRGVDGVRKVKSFLMVEPR